MDTKQDDSVAERGTSGASNNSENVCCRTCLRTEDLVSLFGNFGEEKMSHHLKLVTGLEIKKNDGLPQKVCTKCLGIFNLALQFRYKCKRAEDTLLGMLSVKPTGRYVLEVEGLKITNIKVEKEEYKHAKVEFEPRTRIKVENNNVGGKSIMEMKFEGYKHEDMPMSSSVCDMPSGEHQSEDDFEWKEDVKMVEKKKRKSKPPKEIIRRRIVVPNGPPYPCSTCGQEFNLRSLYLKHCKRHNYHVCEACGKRFISNHSLLMHKRAIHGLERIYSCTHCEYNTANKEALTVHERLHTGERPYICDHCGASFHRRMNLVQHLPVHLPESNFQCTMCPHQGKSKKRLQIHVWSKHRVERYRYKCALCLSTFRSKKNVHRHLTRVHGVPRADHPPVERVPIDYLDKD